MAIILNIKQIQIGVVGFPFSQWNISTNATLSEATTEGFLNENANLSLYDFGPDDFALLSTSDSVTIPVSFSITDGVITLSSYNISSITLDGDPAHGLTVNQSPPGTWTISLDQNLTTTGLPTFSDVTLTNLSGFINATYALALSNTSAGLLSYLSPTISTPRYLSNNSLGSPMWDTVNLGSSGVSGVVRIINGGTNSSASLSNGLLMVSNSGSIVEINEDTSVGGYRLTNLATPTQPSDAVNKTYADNLIYNLNVKDSCLLATTTALPANTYNNGSSGIGATLTGNSNGLLVIDSQNVVLNSRVLIKSESNQAYNGIYVVTATGGVSSVYILTRANDFNSPSTAQLGDYTYISEGTVNSGTTWAQTSVITTIGTSPITFSQIGGATSVNILGTTNQIIAMLSGNTYTLSAPQNLNTSANFQVGSLLSSGTVNPLIRSVYTNTQSTTSGGATQNVQDDGTALQSGNRLGSFSFLASYDSSHAYNVGAAMRSFATQNWTSSANGAQLQFYTTPNNTTTPTAGLTIGQDQSLTLAVPLSVTNGGTGASSYNTNGVLISGTTSTSALSSLSLSSGQIVIGGTGSPAAALLTAGSGISITNGNNSITISASGSSGISTLTGNSGGAISPSAGNINTLGTGSITIAGSGSTLTTQLTGLTNHNLLIGQGTTTIGVIAPSSTSGIPLISQGVSSNPIFGTALVAGGGTGVTSVTIAPTATAFAGWDANLNLSANNFIPGYATYTTSQTLTAASPNSIYMTGSTASQSMTLPVVSTYSATGALFEFVNNSSQSWNINSSGGNLVIALPANSSVSVQCILTTGTSAASWNAMPITYTTAIAFTNGNNVTGTITGGNTLSLAPTGSSIVNSGFSSWNSSGQLLANAYLSSSASISSSGILRLASSDAIGWRNNANSANLTLSKNSSDVLVWPSTMTLGVASGNTGTLGFVGTSSGTITIQPQASAGTYNFNLPTTAGSSGNVMTSAGGGSSAMTWTAASITPASSTIAEWDTNINLSANNFIPGYATYTTSQSLSAASANSIYMTGTTASQTMTLPVVSTFAATGAMFMFMNNSTQSWNINSSGANLVIALPAGAMVVVQCILITGTSAASWNAMPITGASITTVGDVTSGTVAFNGTAGTTLTSTSSGFTLLAANNSGGGGGNVSLTGGATSNATSAGGTATLKGGAGNTSGAGGAVTVTGGSGGTTGAGGAVTISGAAGGATSGTGGGVTIQGGNAGGGASIGGSITITSGNNSNNATQAPVNISCGSSGGSGNGSPISITAGTTNAGAAGSVTISSGSGAVTSSTGTPGAIVISGGQAANGGGGSATNVNASTITITNSKGLGTGQVGKIFLQADASGTASGSTLHTSVNRLIINGSVTGLTSGSASTIATATLSSGSMSGGYIAYSVESTDGTNYQCTSGTVAFAITNKAGTISGTATVVGSEVSNSTSGTLTDTFSVTSGGLIQITPVVTVITPTTLRITYTLFSHSQQSITVPS